jgi:hypothetical protein
MGGRNPGRRQYCKAAAAGTGLVARGAVGAYPLAAMTSEPTHLGAAPADRRQPMWPWLLLPLVTLVLFFVLFKLKAADDSSPPVEAPAQTASSDAPSP